MRGGAGGQGAPRPGALTLRLWSAPAPPPAGRQPTCSFLSMKKFVNACEALGLASRAAVLPKDGEVWAALPRGHPETPGSWPPCGMEGQRATGAPLKKVMATCMCPSCLPRDP